MVREVGGSSIESSSWSVVLAVQTQVRTSADYLHTVCRYCRLSPDSRFYVFCGRRGGEVDDDWTWEGRESYNNGIRLSYKTYEQEKLTQDPFKRTATGRP